MYGNSCVVTLVLLTDFCHKLDTLVQPIISRNFPVTIHYPSFILATLNRLIVMFLKYSLYFAMFLWQLSLLVVLAWCALMMLLLCCNISSASGMYLLLVVNVQPDATIFTECSSLSQHGQCDTHGYRISPSSHFLSEFRKRQQNPSSVSCLGLIV